MFAWQKPGPLSVFNGNGEFKKTQLLDAGREILSHGSGSGKPADAELRRHFPGRGRTDEYLRFKLGQNRESFPG